LPLAGDPGGSYLRGVQPVRIYTTDYCGFCRKAKELLTKRQIPFREIDVTGDDAQREWLVDATGRRTVPQIFIGEEPIGGYTDLAALDRSGELPKKLNGAG
jgi:glutaredoxin 3